MERTLTNQKDSGKFAADVMLENFKDSGHPTFQGISALNRGVLEREGGRCTIHFTADSSNAELSFRTFHSVSTEQWRIGVEMWLN